MVKTQQTDAVSAFSHASVRGRALDPRDTVPRRIPPRVSGCESIRTFRRRPRDGPLSERLRIANQKDKLEWPPEYVFVFDDAEVDWRDAVVTWTMLCRHAPKINFLDKKKNGAVRRLLKRVNHSKHGKLRYSRWDRESDDYETLPEIDPA